MVDLDGNATTRLHPQVLERMTDVMRNAWGNASSDNALGEKARELVEEARCRVAELIGAFPKEILFTSGATESINLAVQGAMGAHGVGQAHVVTSCVEHKAVLTTIEAVARRGGVSVTALRPDHLGVVEPALVKEALRKTTRLVCLIHGNNEVGTINPVSKIGPIVRDHGALFFVDAAQSVGHEPPQVSEAAVDLMAISSHKMHGPTGVGALYVRRDVLQRGRIAPSLFGGGQEHGFRPGTLNVAGIVGLGVAAELARAERGTRSARIRALRDAFHARLLRGVRDVRLNGHPSRRLPGNLSLTIPYVEARRLQERLPHLAFSRGSACTSGLGETSHVLRALGLTSEEMSWTIRVCVTSMSTEEEVERAAAELASAIRELRGVHSR